MYAHVLVTSIRTRPCAPRCRMAWLVESIGVEGSWVRVPQGIHVYSPHIANNSRSLRYEIPVVHIVLVSPMRHPYSTTIAQP